MKKIEKDKKWKGGFYVDILLLEEYSKLDVLKKMKWLFGNEEKHIANK